MSSERKVYLVTQQDTNNVLPQVFSELDTILKEEERPYSTTIAARESADKLPIGPDDMRFDASVSELEYGSQAIRYWLTFLTWFGIGASKLRVIGDLRSGSAAPQKLNLYSVGRMGAFGGSNESLMRYNVRNVAHNLARKVTGRRILNVSVYRYALGSLIVGGIGLIPVVGIVISPFGLGFGLAALILMFQRGLQITKKPGHCRGCAVLHRHSDQLPVHRCSEPAIKPVELTLRFDRFWEKGDTGVSPTNHAAKRHSLNENR